MDRTPMINKWQQHTALVAILLATAALSVPADAQNVYPSGSTPMQTAPVQSAPTQSAPVEAEPIEAASPPDTASSPSTKSLGTITLSPGENIDNPTISGDSGDGGDQTANSVAYDEAATNAYNAHSYVEARSLWEKAAKSGDATAMYKLAGMIERGEGGDQDLDQAVGWYSAAAQKGVSGAADKVTALSDRMRKEAVAVEAANQAAEKARQNAAKKQAQADAAVKAKQDQQAAKQAAADAAAQQQVDQEATAKADADTAERPAPNPPPSVTAGPQQDNAARVTSYSQSGKQSSNDAVPPDAVQQMATAQPSAGATADSKVSAEDAFTRGLNAAAGRGVAKDDAEAAKWFRIAADQGYAPAENNLGFLYSEGRGVKKDAALAAIWFKKAADQNYAPAQTSLGMLYATGSGVLKDDTEALALYSSAASQNYAQGTANLAQMYADGRGIEKDERTAQFLLSSVKEKPRQSPAIYVDPGA